MKLFLSLLLSFGFASMLLAEDENKTFFSISMSQDPEFGFYPAANGGIKLNESTYFTYYGVFWTQDLLGGGNGTNLYTEFGAGISYTKGNFTIKPTLGILGGNYQSGGGRPVIGDAIVPSLGLSYAKERLSLDAVAFYWLSLREEATNTPYYDIFQYLILPSYVVSDFFDVGLYFDHLIITEKTNDDKNTFTQYLWIGPSLTMKSLQNASLTFSTGIDAVDYLNDDIKENKLKDYYKLIFTYNL